jgi:hypothetical protein
VNTLQIEAPQDSDFIAAAKLVQETMTTVYPGVTSDITAEALRLHTSDEWLDNKAAEIHDLVISGVAEMRIARIGETVVGFCLGHRNGEGGMLSVTRKHQRGIIGLALIATVGMQLDSTNGAELWVVPRTPAEKFYQSLGFTHTNRDISDQLPVLRGGQTLPLCEMSISADNVELGLKKATFLLRRRGFTPPVLPMR